MEKITNRELIDRFNKIGYYIFHQIKNAFPDIEKNTSSLGYFCMGMNHGLLRVQGLMWDQDTNDVIEYEKLLLKFIENTEKHLDKVKSGEIKSFSESLVKNKNGI